MHMLFLFDADLKTEGTRLEAKATDWQNAFSREQARREELEEELKVLVPEYQLEHQLRIDGERDLLVGLQTAKSLQEENQNLKGQLEALTAAAEPIAKPNHPKSASPKVVFSPPNAPSTESRKAGRNVMISPFTNPPTRAPRRPPVALPYTPAAPPVKK